MQDQDWIFDVIMDLCDKAEHLGLHAMSAKLEEALDAFLEDQGRTVKPGPSSSISIASCGPISLGQDSFVFGSRQPAPKTRSAPKPFASRRHQPGPAMQQLMAVRAKREAEDRAEVADEVQMDKAG
ncbi:MAG: hypothetical protein WBN04_20995 [Paracoccaceae bacterium]